jgi:hypothetical protein
MTKTAIRMSMLAGVLVLVATGCTLELQVTKQVMNGTSSGPFTVTSNCGGPPQTLTFHGPGTQSVDFSSDPVSVTTCTLTETATAGATTVTFACVSPPSGVVCTPTSDGLQVVVQPTESDVTVPITLTNDFATTTTAPQEPTLTAAALGPTTVQVTGSNFPAGTAVTVTIASSPLTLGTVTTSASGTFTATFTVPCSLGAGAHTVTGTTTGGATATAPVVLPSCGVTATFTG